VSTPFGSLSTRQSEKSAAIEAKIDLSDGDGPRLIVRVSEACNLKVAGLNPVLENNEINDVEQVLGYFSCKYGFADKLPSK